MSVNWDFAAAYDGFTNDAGVLVVPGRQGALEARESLIFAA